MLSQVDVLNMLSPLIEVVILVFLMFLSLKLSKTKKLYPLLVLVSLSSITIGIVSIQNFDLPFSPWIQVFFIVFQFGILLITGVNVFKGGGKKR